MNRYKLYASIGLAVISISTVMVMNLTRVETEPTSREADFRPRPTLRPLEVVEPEDTPYTKEELSEIFR